MADPAAFDKLKHTCALTILPKCQEIFLRPEYLYPNGYADALDELSQAKDDTQIAHRSVVYLISLNEPKEKNAHYKPGAYGGKTSNQYTRHCLQHRPAPITWQTPLPEERTEEYEAAIKRRNKDLFAVYKAAENYKSFCLPAFADFLMLQELPTILQAVLMLNENTFTIASGHLGEVAMKPAGPNTFRNHMTLPLYATCAFYYAAQRDPALYDLVPLELITEPLHTQFLLLELMNLNYWSTEDYRVLDMKVIYIE